jgi:hypothetical protein
LVALKTGCCMQCTLLGQHLLNRGRQRCQHTIGKLEASLGRCAAQPSHAAVNAAAVNAAETSIELLAVWEVQRCSCIRPLAASPKGHQQTRSKQATPAPPATTEEQTQEEIATTHCKHHTQQYCPMAFTVQDKTAVIVCEDMYTTTYTHS